MWASQPGHSSPQSQPGPRLAPAQRGDLLDHHPSQAHPGEMIRCWQESKHHQLGKCAQHAQLVFVRGCQVPHGYMQRKEHPARSVERNNRVKNPEHQGLPGDQPPWLIAPCCSPYLAQMDSYLTASSSYSLMSQRERWKTQAEVREGKLNELPGWQHHSKSGAGLLWSMVLERAGARIFPKVSDNAPSIQLWGHIGHQANGSRTDSTRDHFHYLLPPTCHSALEQGVGERTWGSGLAVCIKRQQ